MSYEQWALHVVIKRKVFYTYITKHRTLLYEVPEEHASNGKFRLCNILLRQQPN